MGCYALVIHVKWDLQLSEEVEVVVARTCSEDAVAAAWYDVEAAEDDDMRVPSSVFAAEHNRIQCRTADHSRHGCFDIPDNWNRNELTLIFYRSLN